MEKSFMEQRGRILKRSIIVPILISLLFFFIMGIWAITTIQNFYYEERLEEAQVLASGYAETLSIAMDAQRLLEQYLENTLNAAGLAVSNYPGSFNTESL